MTPNEKTYVALIEARVSQEEILHCFGQDQQNDDKSRMQNHIKIIQESQSSTARNVSCPRIAKGLDPPCLSSTWTSETRSK